VQQTRDCTALGSWEACKAAGRPDGWMDEWLQSMERGDSKLLPCRYPSSPTINQLCVRSNVKGRYSTGTALLTVHPRTAHFSLLVSLSEGQLRLAAVGSLRLPTNRQPLRRQHFANPRPPNLLLRLYNIITPPLFCYFFHFTPLILLPPFLTSCFLVLFVP